MSAWLAWWLALNVATVLVYGYDKAIAGGRRRRIPERTLLAFALLGGSPGALLAMGGFRHKTAKVSFKRAMACIVAAQLVLLAAMGVGLRRAFIALVLAPRHSSERWNPSGRCLARRSGEGLS
ncbi:MAG TPA: DUF1294 domain-containing protein [Telluria sp.]